MPTLELQKELIEKFQKKGELLVIWRCENCGKIIPFYKSGNEFIDAIYLCWAEDHKNCPICYHRENKIWEDELIRVTSLLNRYEQEEWNQLEM